MKTSQQKGFTLIELIMVIVILGVLSAFALPRFANFGSDAEKASVEGARASVQSAAGIVRSTALVNNLGQSTGSVDVEGASVSIVSGYLGAEGVSAAAQLTDFTTNVVSGNGVAHISILDASENAPCFTFTETTDGNTPPTVSEVSTAWSSSDSCDI